MPRKAKSTEKEEKVLIEEKTKEIKPKKTSKKKSSEDNKKIEKKVTTESKIKKKETKKDAERVDTKKKATKKLTTETKRKETKKSTKTSKKGETKKTTKNKTTTKKVKSFLPEYYDLPYRYNETVVKILAQTPKKLFIYWDISDKDVKKYKKVFGENFFYDTYPVLLIHNEEMDYTFEVQVNDFANCWYVDINDPKCKYSVNLGRKFKNIKDLKIDENELKQEEIDLKNDYLQITNSNLLEMPNDRILFEKLGNSVKYRNIKTFEETNKNIESIISENGNILKIYDIYEFYKQIYKNEIDENIFDINNPSSGNTSSKIQFK